MLDIMIKRELHLKNIRGFYDSNLVKIITGMRRTGKSVILSQIITELMEQGIKKEQIINIDFESLEYSDILEAKKLDKYIKKLLVNDEKYYVFLDEIQKVEDFALAVNSLRATENVSLFITGSSSKLMSSELPTDLSGRYVSFYISPFTFAETFQYVGGEIAQREEIFQKYLEWGGMPQIYNLQYENEYQIYIEDLYNSIILRDIVERLKLKDVDLLNRIIQFIIENVGGIFSANSVVKYLKSERLNASPGKIYEYLGAIESALIVSRVNRYDIRSKKVIQFYDKFYMTDLGLAKLKKSSYEKSSGGRLENIVYNELKSRRKEIYIGDINNQEVDFVVKDADGITYIQVAETLSSREVIEREFGAFRDIPDNYNKIVLSLDKIDHSRDGIRHRNIIDWLLED
jgi:predicted AAA+ superfamily ATPase